MNIFEYVARNKIYFLSNIGQLHASDLWELPLETKHASQASLNEVAKRIAKNLKDLGEDDFVGASQSARKEPLEVALEVVKFVIADKKEKAEKAKKRAENAERRRQILEIVASKQTDDLKGKSIEELLKEAELLDA